MATTTTIALKIRTALGDYLKRDPATIKASHHLRDDLGLDSMAVIELLYRVEEAFDIQIPDQDLVGLTTVGHVITYVDKRLGVIPASAESKKTSKPTSKKRS
jgi:acyl carrier protein